MKEIVREFLTLLSTCPFSRYVWDRSKMAFYFGSFAYDAVFLCGPVCVRVCVCTKQLLVGVKTKMFNATKVLLVLTSGVMKYKFGKRF